MPHIYFFILFLFQPFFLYSQQYTYDVAIAGKQVGELHASQNTVGNKMNITIRSDAQFKLLWKKYSRKTSYLLHYENQDLKISNAVTYFNDELEDSVTMKSIHNKYYCYLHPDKRLTIEKEKVNITTANLFFQEPVGIDTVYSERYLEFYKLSSVGNHRYKLHFPDDTANLYIYVKGELKEIVIDRSWFDVTISRQIEGE